jgi:hypothetical protein
VFAVADEATPDLSGRWTLNPERSDNARRKLAEAREAEGRGKSKGGIGGLGPIAPGPRGGGPMGTGPMGSRPTGSSSGRGRQPDDATRSDGLEDALIDPPKVLVITQADGEVTFDTGEESLLRLRPGGRKVKREGGAVELKARWKDGDLVVDAEHEDGPRLTTSYRLSSDRQELYVTSKVETPEGEEVTLRRVYEAAAK